MIRIYLSTPTFDRITKDEKANFEDKLSVIGGTMGLLTGFSIISGVEIVYHAVKIAANFIKKKVWNKKNMNFFICHLDVSMFFKNKSFV